MRALIWAFVLIGAANAYMLGWRLGGAPATQECARASVTASAQVSFLEPLQQPASTFFDAGLPNIEIPDDDKREYEVMMRDVRLQLRERGYYSADMLTLQRRIRCKLDSSRAECADPQE